MAQSPVGAPVEWKEWSRSVGHVQGMVWSSVASIGGSRVAVANVLEAS